MDGEGAKIHDDSPLHVNGFTSKAVHVGQEPEPTFGAVVQPIFMSSTFAQEYPGRYKGYDYTRAGNPCFTVLEKQIAALEGGKHCVVFASGLAAVAAVLGDLLPGDAVVTFQAIYGGTYAMCQNILVPRGVKLVMVPSNEVQNFERILEESRPKAFIFETPTNPLMEIYDIEHLAAIARRHMVLSICDNTFATPYHQSPLALGVDVVLHSCSKYIGGHDDIVGGCIVTNIDHVRDHCEYHRRSLGLNPSPFDAWLLSRSLKTLALRMERHSSNAMAVAKFLQSHPRVLRVFYPGLPDTPNHEVAKKQMKRGFSGMMAVEFDLDLEATKELLCKFKVFTLATSLGGANSLIAHVSTMSLKMVDEEERKRLGVADGLVRISVGIEDEEDLINDLKLVLNSLDDKEQ